MKLNLFKGLRTFFFLSFLTLLLTSCSLHKTALGNATDFNSLVTKLVDESATKIKKNLDDNDIVLVSDFVNLDRLENRSQLGFLLSDMLKDRLVSEDIIVREVEFANEFKLGPKGFNVLIRNKDKIISDQVLKEKFAVVGTYSMTSRSLNVFIKLIDIRTGYIHASSHERTTVDEEILQLEGEDQVRPVFRPRIVL